MRTLLFLGIALVTSLSTATPDTDLDKDHERLERRRTLGQGHRVAEQMRRSDAEASVIVETERPAVTEEEAELTGRLREAKKAGDRAAIRNIEEAVADLRGEPLEFAAGSQSKIPFRAIRDPEAPGEKWLPHEFLLAGGEFDELRPTMASDAAGNLYAAVEEVHDLYGQTCVIYKTTDGGENWERFNWIVGADLIMPSIAVAEGVENWLFVTFNRIDEPSIYVFRQNLDDLAVYDFKEIEYNPVGAASPRIITDCSEFDGWYAYLVFNSCGVDNWVARFSRTIDFGENWTAPASVAGYCGYPDEFYDASQAHPDIECGSDNLYIAFDNYSAPCTGTDRDIFLLTSENYGSSWGPVDQLTTHNDDEHDPAVAAVKNYYDTPTTVVAYTRFYHELDNDVWLVYTQNDGVTWGTNCIACAAPEEKYVNLVTSQNQGVIHAAFWDEFNIDHGAADCASPSVWVREDSISTSNTASDIDYRPGIVVDQTQAPGQEAGIAWTDVRNEASTGLDIYYDAVALPLPPDDFYLYATFDPDLQSVCGIDGFIDEVGAIEGLPGAQYIFFTGGPTYEGDITAYVYRVETDGDPETHPDNPYNPGPVAPRTFTFVNSHYMGYYSNAHDNAFYVDESGIYYGPSDNPRGDADGWGTFMGGGVFQWDFDWNLLDCVVEAPAPGGNQTLARNPETGDWWSAKGNRMLHRWDGASWVYQYTHPHLGGGHHDGMEIVNNSLWISDMTSDVMIQYRLDDAGDAIDPPTMPSDMFFYHASPSVEGMGHGPNNHFWISGAGSGVIYEIGGGALQLALQGIPDQCVLPGEMFEAFDLDEYVTGQPPFSWSWEGNVELTVDIDADNVVTVSYTYGWVGQETITFTVEDGLGTRASDDATFTVSKVPYVYDIPDQTAPFVPIDLDDYLGSALPDMVTWTASGMSCLSVEVDPITHVATVTDPGCVEPEVITFTATVMPCGEAFSDEDAATFTPEASAAEDVVTPVAFALESAVPNPCRSATRVRYSIPAASRGARVTLAVYDVEGRRVRTLVDSETFSGTRVITWDGNDDSGQPVSSGTYFFRLTWNNRQAAAHVLLLR